MMKTYASLDEMWVEAVRDVLDFGDDEPSRDGETRELLGWCGRLKDPLRSWLSNERRSLSPYYAAAEVLWYFTGDSSVEMIKAYSPQYERFADLNGKAHGAYGLRLGIGSQHNDSMRKVVQVLQENADSRRVVARLWRHDDLWHGHGEDAVKDVPCTLTWQFLVRDEKLHMIVNMRSQDLWLGMPYDIFWNCLVQRVVAWELGLELGWYQHQCGSIHIYDRHMNAARESIDAQKLDDRKLWQSGDWSSLSQMREVAQEEKKLRSSEHIKGSFRFGEIGDSLLDLCCRFLHKTPMSSAVDPVLRAAVERYDLKKEKK